MSCVCRGAEARTIILHADKGNATVVIDTKDYDKKAKTLLQDEDSYSRLDSDPTRATERKLLSLLRSLKKIGKITNCYYHQVRPSGNPVSQRCFTGERNFTNLQDHCATGRSDVRNMNICVGQIIGGHLEDSGRLFRGDPS